MLYLWGITKFEYNQITLSDIENGVNNIIYWVSYFVTMLTKLPPPKPPSIIDEFANYKFSADTSAATESNSNAQSCSMPTTREPTLENSTNGTSDHEIASENPSKNQEAHETKLQHQEHKNNVCFSGSGVLQSADTILFDTDLVLLFIDSCVTDGMTPSLEDFEPGTYQESSLANFVGSGGNGRILGHGTAQYVVNDNDGVRYTLRIQGMAYSPTVPHQLVVPQYLKKIERLKRE